MAELKQGPIKSEFVEKVRQISVLPPSSNDAPPPVVDNSPHRTKDGIITRAGMVAQIKRGGSILFDATDGTGPRSYTRVEDLPSEEQVAAYVEMKTKQIATIGASK